MIVCVVVVVTWVPTAIAISGHMCYYVVNYAKKVTEGVNNDQKQIAPWAQCKAMQ